MPKLEAARIIKNTEIASDYFLLRVRAPQISSLAEPGQFAHISCGQSDIILRRPFSFYKVEGEDISFLYQTIGKGTSLLKTRSPGEKISILGPLGRGFWFEKNAKKKIIIAGGAGIAPFPFLIKEMFRRGIPPKDIVLIYGARRKESLVELDEFQKAGIFLYVSTDDGSYGFKGTASELLSNLIKKEKLDGDYFICGPENMMKSAVKITKRQGLQAEVSLEEKMACGLGGCLSCVKRINGQYQRVCKEGPVFRGDEVEW